MAEIDITRMSSKGQIVIPKSMRKGFKEGEKIVVIQNEDQIILKNAKNFDENLEEDLEFAERTEEAYKEIEKGNYTEESADDFLNKLENWAKQ